jgi:hypothetical protein
MATALLIGGAGLAVAGQIKQGQIAAAQGKFEQKIAARNQQALNRQAKAEIDAAKIDESRISRKAKITQARLQVAGSKSGIGITGATLNALTDAAFQFSLDRNLTLRRGFLRSRELTQRGSILSAQGAFAKVVGRQKRTASFIKAGGTALFAGSQFNFGKTPPTNIGSPEANALLTRF